MGKFKCQIVNVRFVVPNCIKIVNVRFVVPNYIKKR